jgi:hypothetical protein
MQKHEYNLKLVVTTQGFKNNEVHKTNIIMMCNRTLHNKTFIYGGAHFTETSSSHETTINAVTFQKVWTENTYYCTTGLVLNETLLFNVDLAAFLTNVAKGTYSTAKFNINVVIKPWDILESNNNNNIPKVITTPVIDIRHMTLMVSCVRFQRGMIPLKPDTSIMDVLAEYERNNKEYPIITSYLLSLTQREREQYYNHHVAGLRQLCMELASNVASTEHNINNNNNK